MFLFFHFLVKLFFATDGWGGGEEREGYIAINAYMFSQAPILNLTLQRDYNFSQQLPLTDHGFSNGANVVVEIQVLIYFFAF